ncbi:acyl-homoserine-lactone synthase [Methyloraptor flagellatus]|jgi:acyl-homoserine lactone synthase|uniref:Acyl-homoserine-lactone synthase n=1 Tax=Methyloraptor flagellatus TaxID=3162530 RepID=A0AAU7X956_9HYPH
MILVIPHDQADQHTAVLEQAWRLRHRVFVEERGWSDLARPDQREMDAFDTEGATHICVMRGQVLVAYARLLETTRPHLLSDVLSHLCQTRPIPRGPNILEWTRHCVAPDYRGQGFALGQAERELMLAIVEHALENRIEHLTAEAHPVWITRLLRLGFEAEPLCLPTTVAGEPAIGLFISVSDKTLEKTRRVAVRTEAPADAVAMPPAYQLPPAALNA